MGRYLITILLTFCFHINFAQKSERRIYVLDGTASMTGYGGAPNIWNDVKDKLLTNVAEINESKSDVILIVFSKGIDSIIKGKATIVDFIKNFTPDGKYTNIVAGWDKAVSMINSTQYNFITLLTDGKDNQNPPGVLKARLSEWCTISKQKNAYACIVRLTENAKDLNLSNNIDPSCNLRFIDGIKFPAFIQIQKQDVSFNLKGGYDKKNMDLFVTIINELDLPNNLFINAEIQDAPFLHLASSKIEFKKGQGSIPLTLIKDKDADVDAQMLPFNLVLKSNKEDVIIVNDHFPAVIENYPQPELNVKINPDFGKKDHYKRFLFWKASNPPYIKTVNLNWNKDAIDAKSEADIVFEFDNIKANKFSLFHNQKLVEGNTIHVSATDTQFELQILLDPSVNEGVYNGNFYTKTKYLMKSNISSPIISTLKYTESWNPLKTILFWFMIILVSALILWIFIFKHLFYPVFPAISITVQSPYYKLIKLKKARKIICYNQIKKQSGLASFFKGKVIYEENSIWTDEWIVFPHKKNQIKPKPTVAYAIDPFSATLQKTTQYFLTNLNSNQKIEISIM